MQKKKSEFLRSDFALSQKKVQFNSIISELTVLI